MTRQFKFDIDVDSDGICTVNNDIDDLSGSERLNLIVGLESIIYHVKHNKLHDVKTSSYEIDLGSSATNIQAGSLNFAGIFTIPNLENNLVNALEVFKTQVAKGLFKQPRTIEEKNELEQQIRLLSEQLDTLRVDMNRLEIDIDFLRGKKND